MPKVIFRPNPTPPPFVPPPPTPTDNLLQITPYPFRADEEFYYKIFNLQQIEDHKLVEFQCHVSSSAEISTIGYLSIDGSPIVTEGVSDINHPSSDLESFSIKVTKNDNSTYRIPLTLVQSHP